MMMTVMFCDAFDRYVCMYVSHEFACREHISHTAVNTHTRDECHQNYSEFMAHKFNCDTFLDSYTSPMPPPLASSQKTYRSYRFYGCWITFFSLFHLFCFCVFFLRYSISVMHVDNADERCMWVCVCFDKHSNLSSIKCF